MGRRDDNRQAPSTARLAAHGTAGLASGSRVSTAAPRVDGQTRADWVRTPAVDPSVIRHQPVTQQPLDSTAHSAAHLARDRDRSAGADTSYQWDRTHTAQIHTHPSSVSSGASRGAGSGALGGVLNTAATTLASTPVSKASAPSAPPSVELPLNVQCRGGCGFFGSEGKQLGLCSTCFKRLEAEAAQVWTSHPPSLLGSQ